MKLAVAVIAALAIVLIFATIYEANYSTEAVMRVVYTSWWFCALLSLLGLSVLCSTLVCFPWKRSQWGFVITHTGILAILIGAVLGLLGGKEGYITLIEGGDPVDAITTRGEILQVGRSGENSFLKVPLSQEHLRKAKNGISINTKKIIAPDVLSVVLLDRLENTEEKTVVTEGNGDFNPALQIGLRPPGGGEDTEITEWLVSSDPERQIMQMGPLLLRILKIDSEAKLNEWIHPDSAKTNDFGKIVFQIEGTTLTIPVKESVAKEVKSQDGKITVLLKEYYPDFQMDTEAGKPVSLSDSPNNPAVQYEVSWGKDAKAYGFAFADYPELGMMRVEGADEKTVNVNYDFDRSMMDVGIFAESNTVYLLAGPGEQLHFIARRPGENRQIGTLKLNEVVPLEWKMNPGLRVKQFIPIAESKQMVVPASLESGAHFTRPALELKLTGQGYTTNIFVQWNRPFEIIASGTPLTFLYTDGKIPIDFNIQLLKFNMPTFEGTDMPASYESLVRITNPKTGDALEHKIWMNHPMSYGGYRISQSGYSKTMGITTSTLQLLADPGSPLKWIGSILVMLGITLMYFWHPKKKEKSC